MTIARVHRRLRKSGAPRRVAVQSQCSTQRKPSARGGLFPTKAMSRPTGRSRPSIDPDSAAARPNNAKVPPQRLELPKV